MGNQPSQQASPAGEGFQHLRAEAGKHAQVRNAAFAESQAEYRRGCRARAKELSNQGKLHHDLMLHANRRAADAIFAANNQGRAAGEVDLHGLYVREAVERLDPALAAARAAGLPRLVLIVGAGNHSVDGVQRLKPAVEAALRDAGLAFAPDQPNRGCVTVLLDQAPAWPARLRAALGALSRLVGRLFGGGR